MSLCCTPTTTPSLSRNAPPELLSRSNNYLMAFVASGIISFSAALYLKREKIVITELLVFIVGISVILGQTLCV